MNGDTTMTSTTTPTATPTAREVAICTTEFAHRLTAHVWTTDADKVVVVKVDGHDACRVDRCEISPGCWHRATVSWASARDQHLGGAEAMLTVLDFACSVASVSRRAIVHHV
jgi:hypothetical protein